MSNALVKYLDVGQKDVIAMAYASFKPNMTGPVAFPLQQGIKGLLFELNKGCKGGYVAPFYLREKLEQIIGAIEDEDRAGNPDAGSECKVCGEGNNHDGEECPVDKCGCRMDVWKLLSEYLRKHTIGSFVLAKGTPVRYHHREEDDGQPDEAKEWEDLEGPQEYDDPLDVSEV